MKSEFFKKYCKATELLHLLRGIAQKDSFSIENRYIINSLNTLCENSDSTVSDLFSVCFAAFQNLPIKMIQVEGGTLPKGSEISGLSVVNFWISAYDVTWEIWHGTRVWSAYNGYDIINTDEAFIEGVKSQSNSKGDEMMTPVVFCNWYDCLKWCNARSEMEGLEPVYSINSSESGIKNLNKKEIYRKGEPLVVHFNKSANGYRLPTESEWGWTSRGGKKSKGYKYSGSDSLKAVGWYADNSGGEPQPVGKKIPNELGIYDMSGNVSEWCWDANGGLRITRGGCWNVAANQCVVSARGGDPPTTRNRYIGLRLARNA